MKRYLNLTIIALLLSSFLLLCKEPDEGPDNNDDPFSSYDTVTPAVSFWQASLADYLSFVHFYYEDHIYIVPTGERYDIEVAKLSTDAAYYNVSSIYESDVKLDITSAFQTEGGGILTFGGVYNETPASYTNPFYKADDDLLGFVAFDWEGESNYFDGVTVYDPDYALGALFLARDVIGMIGDRYPVNRYSMVFSEHYGDSAQIIQMPWDSCYIAYYDKPAVYTERFVGVKIDGTDADTALMTHMFYFENAGGNQVEYDLGDLCPGKLEPDNLYYENANPLKIYRWNFKAKNILTLEKYSHTGNKEYSRDITLFEYTPLTEAVCRVEKSADHNYCLIYGYFIDKSSIPDLPVFKGNFLIRVDDEGNETHRVIWNEEDIEGKPAGEQHIQDIGDNRYVLLYSFDFENDNDYFLFERIDL